MNISTSTSIRALAFGFWSAVLAAGLAIAFAILAVAFPAPEWHGIQAYAEAFRPVQMASFIPAALLSLAVVVVMVSLHYAVPEEGRIYTLLAVVLTVMYATFVCFNYYLQLFVVRLNLLAGQLEGLALLAMPNFHSAFFALEAIGYFFASLATLAAAPVFSGGRLEGWIRGLFILNGAIGVFGIIVAPFDRPFLILATLGLWVVYFPIAMILVALYFRNARKAMKGP